MCQNASNSGIADVQVGLLEGEQRSAVGLGEQQGPRVGAEGGRGVGRRLHEQLDLLAPLGADGDEMFAVIGREALDGPTVAPDEGFGAEAGGTGVPDGEAQSHLTAGPVGGNRAAQPEPGGVPRGSPRPSEREGRVVGGQGVGHRDGLAVHVVGGHLQRDRGTSASGADEFVQDPVDPADADRVFRAHSVRV